jgi:hypothetical protein
VLHRAVWCQGEAGDGVDGGGHSLLDAWHFGARNGNTRVGKMKEGVEEVLVKLFIGPKRWGDNRLGRRDDGGRWWSS